MNAFDADVLIYAAAPGHPLGDAVSRVLDDAENRSIGSVLLLPELLVKPLRGNDLAEHEELVALLAKLELLPLDEATSTQAVALGVEYGLGAVDSVHLATAINAGADRFITNNRRDFRREIGEIDVVYPDDL